MRKHEPTRSRIFFIPEVDAEGKTLITKGDVLFHRAVDALARRDVEVPEIILGSNIREVEEYRREKKDREKRFRVFLKVRRHGDLPER